MSARIDTDLSAGAAWAQQAERSNLAALRAMRWVATHLGRRFARFVLHPIALYFLMAGGEPARQSTRYLAHVFGRTPTWRERYRHIHHFAATILDRVYLLQGRLEQFDVKTECTRAFDDALSRGRGVLLVGAHFGSFEALRSLGESRGDFHVAMVMYEENARLINAALNAVAPNAALNTIMLGRLDAMLKLREWLDAGGVAGLLADRASATDSQRAVVHQLPFLGDDAAFSDGPFRLAAMLRREVVFMVGLYHGGNRYELRFLPLADFSQRSALPLESQIAQAVKSFAGILENLCRETPYNWFNFFDFWAEPKRSTKPLTTSTNDAP